MNVNSKINICKYYILLMFSFKLRINYFNEINICILSYKIYIFIIYISKIFLKFIFDFLIIFFFLKLFCNDVKFDN